MSVERAQADLMHLEGEVETLRKKISVAQEKIAKIQAYLEMAHVYGGGTIVSTTGEAGSRRGGRPAGVGIAATAVELSIAAIREAREPLHTRTLLRKLAEQGIAIGGANPIANLSGFLTRSEELKNSRADGWSLAEWPTQFPAPAKPDESTMATFAHVAPDDDEV